MTTENIQPTEKLEPDVTAPDPTFNERLADEFYDMAKRNGFVILDDCGSNDTFFFMIAKTEKLTIKIVNTASVFAPTERMEERPLTVLCAAQIGRGAKGRMLEVPSWVMRLNDIRCPVQLITDEWSLNSFFERR